MTPQDAEKLAKDIKRVMDAKFHVASEEDIIEQKALECVQSIIRQLIDIVRVQHEALDDSPCECYEGQCSRCYAVDLSAPLVKEGA